MSAFVVDTKTMDRVILVIAGLGEYGAPMFRTFAGVSLEAKDAPTEIGRRLFTLNVEAVTQRYPDCDDKPSDMPGTHDAARLPTTYRYTGRVRCKLNRVDKVNGVKAMQCLRYQCAEGDVPERAALFAELSRAIGETSESIVRGMLEYEQAPWG